MIIYEIIKLIIYDYIADVEPDYYRFFEVKRGDEPFTIECEYYSRKKAELEKALQKIKNYSEK